MTPTQEAPLRKIHFPHLDGLRGVAAVLVALFHSGVILVEKGHDFFLSEAVSTFGRYGVDVFFCLSGFLITFLLVQESEREGRINIKNFYVRRMLRIWPLYFLVGIGGILILPLIADALDHFAHVDLGQYAMNLAFLFTFSTNFQIILGFLNPSAIGTFWTVGMEEQFYIIWAPLIAFFRKHLDIFILACVLGGLVVNLYLNEASYYYNTFARILNFGSGALIAIYFDRIRRISFFSSAWFALIALASAVVLNIAPLIDRLGLNIHINVFEVISTMLLIVLFTREDPLISLNTKVLRYLGTVSYGVYVFHNFCGKVVYAMLPPFLEKSSFLPIVFPIALVALTVGASSLSWFYFEKPILRLKAKYQ